MPIKSFRHYMRRRAYKRIRRQMPSAKAYYGLRSIAHSVDVCDAVFVRPVMVSARRSIRWVAIRNSTVVVAALMLVGVLAYVAVLNSPAPRQDTSSVQVLNTVFGYIYAFLTLLSLIGTYLTLKMRRRMPAALLITSMLRIADALERAPITRRRGALIVRELEACAKIAERPTFRIKSKDKLTDAALRSEMRDLAGTIRWWKSWVLWPTPLTRTDLIWRISLAILAVETGDWRLLPLRKSEAEVSPLRTRVIATLPALAPIVMALVAILGLRSIGLQVDIVIGLAIILPALTISAAVGRGGGSSGPMADTTKDALDIVTKLGIK